MADSVSRSYREGTKYSVFITFSFPRIAVDDCPTPDAARSIDYNENNGGQGPLRAPRILHRLRLIHAYEGGSNVAEGAAACDAQDAACSLSLDEYVYVRTAQTYLPSDQRPEKETGPHQSGLGLASTSPPLAHSLGLVSATGPFWSKK